MNTRRDPFEVLGVTETADDTAIKSAYRGLVKTCHPDVDRSAAARERFDEIQGAYEVLMDPSKRAQALRARGARARPATPEPADLAGQFGAFFDNVDKNGRGRPLNANPSAFRRPGRQTVDFKISLEQAFAGGEFEVPGASGPCVTCGGDGNVISDNWHRCEVCDGHGMARAVRGIITVENECPSCEGRGRTRRVSCTSCAGSGRANRASVKVAIPPGCRDGYRITQNNGHGARGWGAIDLAVVVAVESHERFYRDGEDLHARLTVPVWAAALGDLPQIVGIDGRQVTVPIRPGTQSGDEVRIAGAGMPAFSGRGEMVVEILIDVPAAVEGELKEIFERLKASTSRR